jgi:hypothetical protein
MLKDRLLLIESEIERLRVDCARMYKETVLQGLPLSEDYYTSQENLHTFLAERDLVQHMILDGGWE